MSVIEKQDLKGIVGLVTNAKQVVTSVQDVARKLADFAKFTSKKRSSGKPILMFTGLLHIFLRHKLIEYYCFNGFQIVLVLDWVRLTEQTEQSCDEILYS